MQKTLKKYFPIFVLPTLIAFCFAFIAPFIMGVYLSFCKFTTVTNAKFIGFKNYMNIFSNKDFANALGFTCKFTIVAVLMINVLAFALALALTRKIKGTNLFRTVFFMPNLIGGIILGYIWQQMINAILLKYETTLVANAKYGYWGLIILMNWQMIGYMMIIYVAGLQNVPTELIEAAQIDGATPWQVLKFVKVPMVMPSITICLFMTLSNCFKIYDVNVSLTGGGPNNATQMVAMNIFNEIFTKSKFGYGQAKAIVLFIIVAIITLLQVHFTKDKEVSL